MGDIVLFLQINTDVATNFTSISPRLGGKLGKTIEIIHCTPSKQPRLNQTNQDKLT